MQKCVRIFGLDILLGVEKEGEEWYNVGTTQKILKSVNREVGVFTIGKNASFLFRVLLY